MDGKLRSQAGGVGRRGFLAGLGGGAALALLARDARADIILPGTVRIAPLHQVDLGPYAAFAVRRHVVVKGDTFESLAARYLGTTARAADIQRANPDVLPEKIKVGSTLSVPSRQAALGSPDAKKDALPGFAFYFVESRMGPSARPVADGEAIALGSNPSSAWTIAAVPATEIAKFEALFAADAKGRRPRSTEVSTGLAALKVRLGPPLEGLVHRTESSRVKSVLHRHEVKAIDATTITVATTKTESFTTSESGKPKKAMIGLSAGGIMLALVLAFRRRRETRSIGERAGGRRP